MNIPENVESDYLEFLNQLNIYSLNEEEKKINKMNNESYSPVNSWSSVQKKEYCTLITYLNEKYPTKNVKTYIKENNQIQRRLKCKELTTKFNSENKKYKINKELYLRLINDKKQILMNETKNKEKQKALEEITCECGLQSKRKNIAAHRKSANHIKLMSIAKEIPICPEIIISKEIPTIITEKEEKIINKVFQKIMEEEEEENYDDDEEDENIFITSKPFTLDQIKQFRIKNNLSDDYPLTIEKDIDYRKKWNILDTDLRMKCLKEKGFTVMPIVIIGII